MSGHVVFSARAHQVSGVQGILGEKLAIRREVFVTAMQDFRRLTLSDTAMCPLLCAYLHMRSAETI